MSDRIKSLYKTHILEKAKNEVHVGQLSNPTHVLVAYNPMCGDKYTLYLNIENEIVREVKFEGYGCAISKASTVTLIECLSGKRLEEIKPLVDDFLELVNPDSDKEPEQITTDEDLLAFAAAREFPERKICATLSWDEFVKAFQKDQN